MIYHHQIQVVVVLFCRVCHKLLCESSIAVCCLCLLVMIVLPLVFELFVFFFLIVVVPFNCMFCVDVCFSIHYFLASEKCLIDDSCFVCMQIMFVNFASIESIYFFLSDRKQVNTSILSYPQICHCGTNRNDQRAGGSQERKNTSLKPVDLCLYTSVPEGTEGGSFYFQPSLRKQFFYQL